VPDDRNVPPWVGVVIPAYNPGARLEPVLEKVLRHTRRVLVVDDGTTDGGTDCADQLGVEVFRFPVNRGKGYALITGYARMLADPAIRCVASMDADGQHDPDELPGLCAAFDREDSDLLIGSRDFGSGHVPLRSRFGNVLTIGVTRLLLGVSLPDTQSGYRLLSRRFLETVLPEVRGGRYETEMELLALAITGGFRVTPAPIRTLYETGNPSSHFHKVRDSYRIYRKLLSRALRRR
jgi:glycosyltransferase involved in cell wall biosynthesis